ncbi:MAG: lipid-A-disaccharide synthase [Ignavibacteriaceae bacterium]|nr:lipid-A-disaccharide synthase [Ignavibacteriaceae bacterium]
MAEQPPRSVLIVAGEVSGDNHASAVLHKLREKAPALKFFGIGGNKMREENAELIEHIDNMAFLGFFEVLKHIPFIRKVQDRLMEVIRKEGIDTAVLVDYPGFNLNFARRLKKAGIRVIYYISPQIWAWAPWRIRKIKRLVDRMLYVFPFEGEIYRKAGLPAVYTGHPLVEKFSSYPYQPRGEFFSEYGLRPEKEILLLLPGSRSHEISMILPVILPAAKRLSEEFGYQIVAAGSPTISDEVYNKYLTGTGVTLIRGKSLELMKYASFGIIKSGTSTMEAGLSLLAMVVVYKTSSLTYSIGKLLIRLKNIAMANIIAGETVVPELIQDDCNPDKIYQTAAEIISSSEKKVMIKEKFAQLRAKLGEKTASETAADEIIKFVYDKRS